MTFNDYQQAALRTWKGASPDHLDSGMSVLFNAMLGLAGEAGEVAERIKKQNWPSKPGDQLSAEEYLQCIWNELGDALYYLAIIAHLHDLKLDDIATANIGKLLVRHRLEGSPA